MIETAVAEARAYRDCGYTALMIENMHDRPYLKGAVGPEVVAAMTAVGQAVRREVALPLGVQVLAGANREAVAVALACGADFVRVEGFVFAHVADEGLIEASAGELLRYRRAIGAERVRALRRRQEEALGARAHRRRGHRRDRARRRVLPRRRRGGDRPGHGAGRRHRRGRGGGDRAPACRSWSARA